MEAENAERAGKLMSEHLDNGGRATLKHFAETLSPSAES